MTENKRFKWEDVYKWEVPAFLEVMNGLDKKNQQLKKENEQLKDILKDITIQLDANHTMNTYQMIIPINRVIYNELNRRLKGTSFNEELRRFLDD